MYLLWLVPYSDTRHFKIVARTPVDALGQAAKIAPHLLLGFPVQAHRLDPTDERAVLYANRGL